MSRFFPTAEYAEDQPLSRTILTTHVLARGATTGAIVGGSVFAVRNVYRRMRPSSTTAAPSSIPSAAAPATAAPATALPRVTWPRQQQQQQLRLLRATGTGTAVGTAVVAVLLALRMQGREEIEWKDRSWRLQQNKTQVAYDDWNCGGVLAGLGGVALSGAWRGAGWRGAVGAAGAGSVIATVGYMAWTYGVKGGKESGN